GDVVTVAHGWQRVYIRGPFAALCRSRIALAATGAALATGFALAAGALTALGDGQYHVPVAAGLLDQPGTRAGVIVALLLLLVPVDRHSTRLNSRHVKTSDAVFCLKKK